MSGHPASEHGWPAGHPAIIVSGLYFQWPAGRLHPGGETRKLAWDWLPGVQGPCPELDRARSKFRCLERSGKSIKPSTCASGAPRLLSFFYKTNSEFISKNGPTKVASPIPRSP